MSDNPITDDTGKVTPIRDLPSIDDTNPNLPPMRNTPQRGNGCGCWIAGGMALLVALVLIGVGLFLPPVNLYDRLFGTRYAMLDAVSNGAATTDQSLKLVLDTADVGREFGVNLSSVPMDAFQNVNLEAGAWIPAAKAAVPPYLALQSPIYTLDTTGSSPQAVTFDLALPSNAQRDRLDVYGYDLETQTWAFLPAQPNTAGRLTVTTNDVPDRLALFGANPPAPTIIVPVDITQTLTANVAEVATIVSPAGMQPSLDGSLVGSLAPGFDTNSAYRVMPVVRNFLDPRALDPDTVTAILGNRALRATHVQQLAGFAGGFDGVFIDYRQLPADQRDNFSQLMRELRETFRSSGLLLGVVVPAANNTNGVWDTGAYDWREIGQYADYLMIDLPLNPQNFTPGEDRLVEAMLRWGVGEVSRYKLIAGLNALSVREMGGEYAPIGYDEALAGLGDVEINAEANPNGIVAPGSVIQASLDGYQSAPGLDTQLRIPFVEYLNEDGTNASTVWLMTGDALRTRLDRFDQFAVGGAAFTDLTAEGVAESVLDSLLSYQLQLPNGSQPSELQLRWRVEDANGLINEVVTNLNEDLVVTLEAVEGNFAINVEVIGGEEIASVRSGAAVAQFAPTRTPTAIPTETPTSVPSPTFTLVPIVATSTTSPNSVGAAPGGPVSNPGPGSIVVGNFEYGGHVTSSSSSVAVGAMQRAGMTWMKVQVQYFPGKNPGDVASIIQEARNRGFKILIGTVGNPNDLAAGGAGYIGQFTDFLGGVASQGPDAIEVWNEPNINREWQEGAISGANYTSMLSQAYGKIKAANGSVLVISAALAPTGAEAAFPGKVVNDNTFLSQMVAAGAMNSLDCVGMHYNEGIVAPSQTSGDPRDDYYSRYFSSMVDTYWGITGGAKPLCFTELGYLTPEGYGPLTEFFAWGANTSVAQQAAWLAEAISLGSRTGKVRMIIVWNVDFTAYGSDPQGGFAMVRPGGGCPACDAIAAAR